MKPSTIFILKLILIITSFFIMITMLVMPRYSTEYTAALRDKFARVRAIGEPKIVLVGGSNVVFGFDSELLEQEMAMPVVNFGLHANLGQAFHSDLLKPYLGPGDIVIIAPEYYDYLLDSCDYVLALAAIENDLPLLAAAARSGHLSGLLEAFPTYFRRAMDRYLAELTGSFTTNELNREYFNAWGDYSAPRPDSILEIGSTSVFTSAFLSDFLGDYWNDLNDYITGRGAALYMSCPPVLAEELAVDLAALQIELGRELNFPVISRLADYVFPREYFYDTGFHLNDLGRQYRTEQLIRDLKTVRNS